MGTKVRTAVVLLQLGGPDTLDAIEPFLRNLFGDKDIISLPWPIRQFVARRIAKKRAPKVRPVYERLGGGTPLIPQTMAQAKTLERRLSSLGFDFPVRVGMRTWHPFIEDVVRELVEQGTERIIALPLYPHSCRATSVNHIKEVERVLKKLKANVELISIDGFAEHPRYVECMAELLQRTLSMDAEDAPQPMHILFTAHSIPVSFLKRKTERYIDEVEASVRAIVSRIAKGSDWSLCYQSRLGRVEWVGPYTEERIVELAKEGVRSLVVVPVSFVSEHIETLHELDEDYYEVAVEAGIERFMRVATPQTNPIFIDALADLVEEAIGADRDANAS
jgi:ferrochelatase